MKNLEILLHRNDIPADFVKGASSVAVDTEAMGLMPHRDRLCLVQLCFDSNPNLCHLIQFDCYENATNLKALLLNESILKVFHYARFDITMIYKYLTTMTKNLYCTKIVSKLVRTFADRHSLSKLCEELLGVHLSKEQGCTDWGNPCLTEEQKQYAALDVLYLHDLKKKLDALLVREKRTDMAQKCFDFLCTRTELDLTVSPTFDVFSHS